MKIRGAGKMPPAKRSKKMSRRGASAKSANDLLKKMSGYSVFAREVWAACASIPAGQTMTYGEVARKIGRAGAARAVARALAANPFAPVIPCHRVVRSDGKLGGYSGIGGVKKKKALLIDEGAAIVFGRLPGKTARG